MKKLLTLFSVFFRIGLFTFGGGYAMIPLIQNEVCEVRHWMKNDEILECIAITESTPGPTATKIAAFAGYNTAGIPGAITAVFGMVLPSFLVIAVLARLLDRYSDLRVIRYMFAGIRAGVLALIGKALFSLYKQSSHDWFSLCIMGFAMIAVAFFKINVLIVICLCALAGLVQTLFCLRRKTHE